MVNVCDDVLLSGGVPAPLSVAVNVIVATPCASGRSVKLRSPDEETDTPELKNCGESLPVIASVTVCDDSFGGPATMPVTNPGIECAPESSCTCSSGGIVNVGG